MKNFVAIGDIHGRTSWKELVNENPNSIFIFTGDYLDPYEAEGIIRTNKSTNN